MRLTAQINRPIICPFHQNPTWWALTPTEPTPDPNVSRAVKTLTNQLQTDTQRCNSCEYGNIRDPNVIHRHSFVVSFALKSVSLALNSFVSQPPPTLSLSLNFFGMKKKMKGMDLSVVPYGPTVKAREGGSEFDVDDDDAALVLDSKPVDKSSEPLVEPIVMNPSKITTKSMIKYRECMRNHAASIGGHANDGCGEFMPAATDSLTCAACGCHRNFHRKEFLCGGGGGGNHHRIQYTPPPQPLPPMLLYPGPTKVGEFKTVGPGLAVPQHSPAPHFYRHCFGLFGDVDPQENHNDDDGSFDRRSDTPERRDVQLGATPSAAPTSRNKRFRTRFTQEQKERMLEFAERSDWRILKRDDVALNQFCSDIGVKRNVLKVWMHNKKNAYRRRETDFPSPPPQTAPAPAVQTQAVGV